MQWLRPHYSTSPPTLHHPSLLEARGIVGDDNDWRNGNVRHDSDHPPDLLRLPKTCKNAQLNTSSLLKLVTHSSPRKKKDPDRGAKRIWIPAAVANHPLWLIGRDISRREKKPFSGPMVIPRKNDMVGKNAPVTLSVSHLNSVRFPILVGTIQFCGPGEIPCILNGVFVGQFLSQPQVQIPADHPREEIIRGAVACLLTLPAYKTRSDYIGHQIWTLVKMNVGNVTHHAKAVAKCPTIRLGGSDECFTYCNAGTNINECPSFRATNTCSDGLPPTGIDYGNGLTFCVTNTRIICKSKNGHCDIWTIAEGKMMAGILIVYIRVIISWDIRAPQGARAYP